MKRILISQRIDHFPERNETRDGLDIKLCKIFTELGYLPIPLPSCFGYLKKSKLIKYIDSFEPHGIVLSGGNNLNQYKERDYLEKILIEYSIIKNKPLLGICRGMQILGNFFGVDVQEVKNHVNSERFIKGEINKKVKCFHEYKISACPKEFNILATSEDGCIESIKSKNFPILGIMWHFERDKYLDKIDKELILELFK